MMFSYPKSHSSLSFISLVLLYIAAATTTILIPRNNPRNYLVEAFAAQHKCTGGALLSRSTNTNTHTQTHTHTCTHTLASSTPLLSSSLLSTDTSSSSAQTKYTATAATVTHPDQLMSDVFVPTLPDDFSSSSIVTVPLPSIVSKSHRTQEEKEKKKKKQQLWHQENGLESTLIATICSYHILRMMLDMVQLSF